jgi:hypothetical protein
MQILIRSAPSRDRLDALILEEPYDIFPLAPSGFLGPEIYVKEHLAPALYLPFEFDLKGVPLAQK